MQSIELSRGFVALVDDEDFVRVNNYKWYLMESRNGYRAGTRLNPGDHNHTYMHSFILGSNQMIDHRDNNGLNNQKSNLRFCTNSQNIANSGARRNNTSGYKGVYLCNCTGRWRAEIKFEGKKKSLGRFDTKQQAAIAYNIAARGYFGEFAYQNPV